ncbi:MAG: DUF952 domain-containing protein [Cyanobacteria bacterium J06649_4]
MLFHITEQSAWQHATVAGTYTAPSLETEGFIHLSTVEQVAATAARFYKGQTGLVLLAIDCDRLQSTLRYEQVLNHGTFPHLYGPLNLSAVVNAWPFDPNYPEATPYGTS